MSTAMDGEQFANELASSVLKAAAGFVGAVKEPPGRRPATWMANLSAWFEALDPDGQDAAENFAIRSVVVGARIVLSVIDGTIAVEPAGPKGSFVLSFHKDGDELVLNPETNEMLAILFGFAIEDRLGE